MLHDFIKAQENEKQSFIIPQWTTTNGGSSCRACTYMWTLLSAMLPYKYIMRRTVLKISLFLNTKSLHTLFMSVSLVMLKTKISPAPSSTANSTTFDPRSANQNTTIIAFLIYTTRKKLKNQSHIKIERSLTSQQYNYVKDKGRQGQPLSFQKPPKPDTNKYYSF